MNYKSVITQVWITVVDKLLSPLRAGATPSVRPDRKGWWRAAGCVIPKVAPTLCLSYPVTELPGGLGRSIRDAARPAVPRGDGGPWALCSLSRLATSAGLDPLGQGLDLVVGGALFRHFLADLAIGVHDGGVVLAAEVIADLRQGELGELAA